MELKQKCIKKLREKLEKDLQGIGIPTMLKEKRAIDQGAAGAATNIAPTSIGAYIDSLQASALI